MANPGSTIAWAIYIYYGGLPACLSASTELSFSLQSCRTNSVSSTYLRPSEWVYIFLHSPPTIWYAAYVNCKLKHRLAWRMTTQNVTGNSFDRHIAALTHSPTLSTSTNAEKNRTHHTTFFSPASSPLEAWFVKGIGKRHWNVNALPIEVYRTPELAVLRAS